MFFDTKDVGKFVRCDNAFNSHLTVGELYEILGCDKISRSLLVVSNNEQKEWYSMARFTLVPKKEQPSNQDNILRQILSITEECPAIEVIVSQGMFSVDYCSDSHHRIIKVGSLQDTLECVKLMKQWLEVEVALKELEEK